MSGWRSRWCSTTPARATPCRGSDRWSRHKGRSSMADWGGFETLLVSQEGRLLTVSFNRPDRLNAVGGGLHQEFTEVLTRAGRDDSVGAILLRGEGRAFCVGGYAMGLGATIALFCDVVVAAEDARFADTHVSVGLVAGDGGAVMWPLIMPFGAAKWYLMTGEPISGVEAARLGMVLKAVPADELLDEATGLAQRLAEGSPLAVH